MTTHPKLTTAPPTDPATADLAARLRAHLEDGFADHLELLRRMVGVNSFSVHPEGVDAVGAMTAEAFAPLGFDAEHVPAEPGFGHHLVLRRPDASGGGARPIVLVSHLDTVYSAAEEAEHAFGWRVEGDRIYGPGTTDIKGGTVVARMALDALFACAPEAAAAAAWVVALDAAEERMAPSFGPLLRELLGADGRACLVFEGGRLDGGRVRLVTARKGMAKVRVEVSGASAHAGNDHALGASAIRQVARLVERIEDLTDPDRDLTVNIGTIQGGTVRNRVPHHAVASIELRAFEPAVLDEAVAALAAMGGEGDVISRDGRARCRIRVIVEGRQAPWPPNPATEALYATFERAAAAAGLGAEREARGGLSDGNRAWDVAPTLDGLGPAGGNMHAAIHDPESGHEAEYVEPASLVPKALVAALAMHALATGEAGAP